MIILYLLVDIEMSKLSQKQFKNNEVIVETTMVDLLHEFEDHINEQLAYNLREGLKLIYDKLNK